MDVLLFVVFGLIIVLVAAVAVKKFIKAQNESPAYLPADKNTSADVEAYKRLAKASTTVDPPKPYRLREWDKVNNTSAELANKVDEDALARKAPVPNGDAKPPVQKSTNVPVAPARKREYDETETDGWVTEVPTIDAGTPFYYNTDDTSSHHSHSNDSDVIPQGQHYVDNTPAPVQDSTPTTDSSSSYTSSYDSGSSYSSDSSSSSSSSDSGGSSSSSD
jgi:hypothetical protein